MMLRVVADALVLIMDISFLSTDHRKVIGTVVSREDYLVPKAGGLFDAEEYDAHPDRYRSTFAEKVLHISPFPF